MADVVVPYHSVYVQADLVQLLFTYIYSLCLTCLICFTGCYLIVRQCQMMRGHYRIMKWKDIVGQWIEIVGQSEWSISEEDEIRKALPSIEKYARVMMMMMPDIQDWTRLWHTFRMMSGFRGPMTSRLNISSHVYLFTAYICIYLSYALIDQLKTI